MNRRLLIALTALWLAATSSGLVLIWKYETTPAASGAISASWPTDTMLVRDRMRPTLVMLAHPRCPCTRASIEELAVIMSRFHAGVRAYVLFVKPEGTEPGWEETYALHRVSTIPGVEVVVDHDGREARRFGASVSGETALYDEEGRLLFAGGITGSRGHVGDNAGRSLVMERLASRTTRAASSPVFGCELGTGRR